MKSIIASLFTIYAVLSSGKRLLQQAAIPNLPTATEPAAAQPGTPGGWVAPVIPSLTGPQYATVMECVLPNTDPAGCAGRNHAIINPSMNFKVKCSEQGACAASTLNFTYVNSMSERVEQVSFSEAFAGYNAKIIMDSTQSPRNQYLDKFECMAPGACQGVVVQVIGGASVNDVNCPRPEYCSGCEIQDCEWTGPPNASPLACGTGKSCFFY